MLDAETVGRVEVGDSPIGRVDVLGWLESSCVATETLVGCIGEAGPLGGPNTDVVFHGAGQAILQGQPRGTTDSPFVVFTEPSEAGVILIGDLVRDVALVEIVTGETLRQAPISGAAAFPFRTGTNEQLIVIRGFDASGTLIVVLEIDTEPTATVGVPAAADEPASG